MNIEKRLYELKEVLGEYCQIIDFNDDIIEEIERQHQQNEAKYVGSFPGYNLYEGVIENTTFENQTYKIVFRIIDTTTRYPEIVEDMVKNKPEDGDKTIGVVCVSQKTLIDDWYTSNLLIPQLYERFGKHPYELIERFYKELSECSVDDFSKYLYRLLPYTNTAFIDSFCHCHWFDNNKTSESYNSTRKYEEMRNIVSEMFVVAPAYLKFVPQDKVDETADKLFRLTCNRLKRKLDRINKEKEYPLYSLWNYEGEVLAWAKNYLKTITEEKENYGRRGFYIR